MSDNLSCLPQSKHLLDLYDDVSDVKPFSRRKRLKTDVATTARCDKDWIYHANGEITGRCILRPLTESSNSI